MKIVSISIIIQKMSQWVQKIDMAIDLTQRQMQSATNHFSLMNQL